MTKFNLPDFYYKVFLSIPMLDKQKTTVYIIK